MPDPLDRLNELAPRIDHARARDLFDRRRRRLRRRRRVLAAAVVVAFAGTAAAFAASGADDPTRVSTANGGADTAPDLSDTTQRPAPSIRVVHGPTGDAHVAVANALLECGFVDVNLDLTAPAPDLVDVSVTTDPEYRDLAAEVAQIVSADTPGVFTTNGPGTEHGIVVTVGPDYSADSLDTSTCPILSLIPSGGPPPPGTEPLLTIETPQSDGTVHSTRIYAAHTAPGDNDEGGICAEFSAGGMGCGGAADVLPAVFAASYGEAGNWIALVGPADASFIEARTDTAVVAGTAHPIPDGMPMAGTVAVLDLSDASRIDGLVATDSSGNVIARNDDDTHLSGVNRGLADAERMGDGNVVWPNAPSTADRSSPASTVEAFMETLDIADFTVDPVAPSNGPTVADVDFGTGTVRILLAPGSEGWVVMQVGDGVGSTTSNPPTLHLLSTVPRAATIQLRVETVDGVTTVDETAEGARDGIPLPSSTALSTVAVYRDADGSVLAVHGGHY